MAVDGGRYLEQYSRISALKEDQESWRIRRLRYLLSLVGKAAGCAARRAAMRKAIARIRDEKGDLKILWDGDHFDVNFIELVREAWRSLGQYTPIKNWIVYGGTM